MVVVLWGCEARPLVEGEEVRSPQEAGVAVEEPPESVLSGAWCGAPERGVRCEGDEALFLVLRGTDARVRGEICESPGQDCLPLEGVKLEGKRLRFVYRFEETMEGRASTGEIRARLEYDGETEVLEGSFWSSKCACEVRRRLWRLW